MMLDSLGVFSASEHEINCGIDMKERSRTSQAECRMPVLWRGAMVDLQLGRDLKIEEGLCIVPTLP